MATARTIAQQVKDEERPRFLSECVEVYSRTAGTGRSPHSYRSLVDFLVMNKLHVMVADKEGWFVVLGESVYFEKAEGALGRNFGH